MLAHTECAHSTLCETQGSQTDKCLDKISIIGTFICLLLIKCFVVERSTAESCDFHWWYCLHCRVEKKIFNLLGARYKISFDQKFKKSLIGFSSLLPYHGMRQHTCRVLDSGYCIGIWYKRCLFLVFKAELE